MVGLSVAKVLVVLTIVALLVASFGAQQRHRRPDARRGPYRASFRRRTTPDPWNWYRWANRVMFIAPGLLLLLRVPIWLALGACAVVWAAALAAVLGFRCPRCDRVFGGFAERCRHCSLPRYADPDPHR